MNQDAFRNLLETESSVSRPSPSSRNSFLNKGNKAGPSKAKAISTSEPAFKPRKVKKASETYRDRAEERRLGKEGDYAQVEAILEEFEKRNADNADRDAVEAQRRYLGGDSEHSILVKGLDFALFEQNKARLASVSSKQDDEALEEVFAQTASPSTSSAPASKKRSRADIIKELKEKRANGAESEHPNEEPAAEKRVDSSKFRPVGFKPIGASNDEKAKKKKGKETSERKKKKRKVESSAVDGGSGEQASPPNDVTTAPPAPVEHQASTSMPHRPTRLELPEEDFDIFEDAGEYKGMELGSDDDDDDGSEKGDERPSGSKPLVAPAKDMSPLSRRGWFDDAAEPEPEASPPPPPPTTSDQPRTVPEAGVEAEEGQSEVQLAPLTSSAMPSIRDFLAMDEAIEKEEKRKARKEKRKGKNKGS